MKRLVAALLLAALPPASAAPAWLPSWIVGTWFGTGQPDDRSEMFLDSMGADGKFHAQHRWCRKGKAVDQVQAGSWDLKGDMLVIRVSSVNGKPSPQNDWYRIGKHDAHKQTYVYLPLNFSYTSSRVPDGFTMPGCDLVG